MRPSSLSRPATRWPASPPPPAADAVEALDELGDTLDKHLEAHDAAIEELETATRQAGAAMTATAKALAQLETGARRPTSED